MKITDNRTLQVTYTIGLLTQSMHLVIVLCGMLLGKFVQCIFGIRDADAVLMMRARKSSNKKKKGECFQPYINATNDDSKRNSTLDRQVTADSSNDLR